MTVQFFLPNGSKIIFQEIIRKNYQGSLLPGSEVNMSNLESAIITIQESVNPLFTISHRIIELFSKINLSIAENSGLRFEALISGEAVISSNNKKIKLKAGQYHLTDIPLFTALFKKTTSCKFFVARYSPELLDQFGVGVLPASPQQMPGEMNRLIQEMLDNPYEEKLRDFYYENCVRELLFFHLAQGKASLPGELDNKDISAIYQADSIIASNLNEHFTIDKLSRLTGTNQFKLKRGFRQIFGMGVFRRLLFLRMEHAKTLLETTDKTIGEIANLAGYDTAAGFIHAFRREFDMTPREWRNQQTDRDTDEEAYA